MTQELIARIEAASGPSYALDCEVWDSIYPGERAKRFAKLTARGKPYHGRLGPADVDGYVQPLLAFTASIDAALTLVPDGSYWQALTTHLGSYGTVMRQTGERANGYAATPALAVCSAALKARKAQQ